MVCFVDFSCSDITSFCQHSPQRFFPFNTHCCLLSWPYYSLFMHFVSCQSLESFRPKFFIIEHPKCPPSHFPCCDNGSKQTPGKGGLHRKKSLINKVRWENTTGMDTVSFEKNNMAETSKSTFNFFLIFLKTY